MRDKPERLWFALCLTLGRFLRSGRYSETRVVGTDGECRVAKRRRGYAPLLIAMGNRLFRIMHTGVRVLPQRAWEDRERRIYQSLYRTSIRIGPAGVLALPRLPGQTLASVLDDRKLDLSARKRAIELAGGALAEFHRRGLTHGDAMAENVMVDLGAGGARWFDFETIHDSRRPMTWRRADDVRALLATCLVRTPPDEFSAVLRILLDSCADGEVAELLAEGFSDRLPTPLAFHLGQAGLSLESYRAIGRLLGERVALAR